MKFHDRLDAANRLLTTLASYKEAHPLVLGIPRGAIVMAKRIADGLQADLDVVLVRKIGAPGNPEYAVGSVDESGHVTETAPGIVDSGYLDAKADEELRVIRDRRKLYTPVRPPIDPTGRTVIIVDDGIATGSTMLAAVRSVRAHKPGRIIAAAPVIAPETLSKLREAADDVVFIDAPEDFMAVAQFYDDFPQVSDDEVVEMLKK
ncbi:MAG TPA: phosphoribosyltransferase family protein [Candidatus Peribacteraceae bacterium]|nr:phosphoribosyltransferase family protein [Candidatus Peribacteraceae bacterium]